MGGTTIIHYRSTWQEALTYLCEQVETGYNKYNLRLEYASITYNKERKEYEIAVRLVK